jgi:hypothetical protein
MRHITVSIYIYTNFSPLSHCFVYDCSTEALAICLGGVVEYHEPPTTPVLPVPLFKMVHINRYVGKAHILCVSINVNQIVHIYSIEYINEDRAPLQDGPHQQVRDIFGSEYFHRRE